MIFLFLAPVSILMGLIGLAAFCWALRNGQFSDLEGAAWRVVLQQQESDHASKTLRADVAGKDAG